MQAGGYARSRIRAVLRRQFPQHHHPHPRPGAGKRVSARLDALRPAPRGPGEFAGVVRGFAQSAWRLNDASRQRLGPALASEVARLVAILLRGEGGGRRRGRRGGRRPARTDWLYREIVSRIRSCDAETPLNAAQAQQLRISLGYVHRILARHDTSFGSCARHLQQAYEMLADARLNHLTIKEVMYRAGFSNFSHFCYAFRQRFGCTAGELRQRGTARRRLTRRNAWRSARRGQTNRALPRHSRRAGLISWPQAISTQGEHDDTALRSRAGRGIPRPALRPHSEPLKRLLERFRGVAVAHKHVLVELSHYGPWQAARLGDARRSRRTHRGRVFDRIEDAEWFVFKARWEQHFGQALQD